ncbi:MAG: hypothetical protein K6F77_10615, partial [Lachnospiraceae bacterium]|nr:hypothetical protein [Lachnospiraceae bacterium]
MKKLNYKRVAKRICSVTLAASLVCTSASYLGISENAEVAQAYNTNNENHVNAYLNNIPLIILYNTSFEGSMIPGDESKDYVKEGLGDWNLEGVTADDTSQVLFKKVLTTPTNHLSAFYTLANNGINSFIGAQNFSFYKGKNADVKLSDVWAQMLITSMSTENGDGYLTDDGYYCTEPQYGINRLEAYESAVENDSYLTDKSISDNKLRKRSGEDQCINASSYLQAYCRGVVGWGRDNTVYQYIKNTYGPNESDEMKDNTPCYCMIVINKTGLIDSNMNFGLENKTPYVYVLYFHDFKAARLTQEYLESAGDDIEVGDTLEDLAEKGITCTGSAVQQYLDEKNGNTSISYDIIEKENGKIYTSKNEAGTEANVSTTYEFSQGETLSVTEESSYTKSVSQELAASGTVSYKFDYGVAGEMGVEFGISTTHSETQEYTKGSGQGYEKSTVETSSAQYSQNMPPHTQNSIVVRPSDTTISYKYTSAVEPRYLTDILMFNPKI